MSIACWKESAFSPSAAIGIFAAAAVDICNANVQRPSERLQDVMKYGCTTGVMPSWQRLNSHRISVPNCVAASL
jgi:hypothetical protein